jgi:GTP-binding protein
VLPVVAIVGRPNVGKSTLFNALTRTRDALVADMPGVTRDRQYGISRVGETPCVLVDTGGLVSATEGIDYLTAKQVLLAIDEAQLVLFVVSARDGRVMEDEAVAEVLRQKDRPVLVVANKTDGTDPDVAMADFAAFGFGPAMPVAAAHRRGLESLMRHAGEILPPAEPLPEPDPKARRMAVIGRPNVGKSTLVNRLLGEERVMAFDMPGTTRDTISTRMERGGVHYELLDTAGVRRRSRVSEALEKFSVIKALQAIEYAHVVVLMLDSVDGLTDQDLTLMSHVLEQGRAMVFALNKWDGLDEERREKLLSDMQRRLPFITWARRVRISALHGSGLRELMRAVDEAWNSAYRDLSTPELNRILEKAVAAHPPPTSLGRSAKLRYAHSGGQAPPRIVIHGNRVKSVPETYKRYLENTFIRALKLSGTPLLVEFRSGDNPFKDRRNTLSERQLRKRKRLKKFTARKKPRSA